MKYVEIPVSADKPSFSLIVSTTFWVTFDVPSPSLGADLGGGLRKVRMAIKSKGTGKSGGARIITVVLADIEDGLGLLYIYDKSERSTIKGKELTDLLKKNGLV